MKNNYFLILSLISSLSFSQQVLKRITDTPTITKIEFYVIRNGTNNSNVVGEDNYDVGSSGSTGTIYFRNPSGTVNYNYTVLSNGSFPIFPTELICNGTLESSTGVRGTRSNFTNSGNTSDFLNISIIRQDRNADILEDSNSLIDVLYSSFEVPKILNDGNSIPINTWVVARSRAGVDLATGGDAPYDMIIGFQFNGTTWVEQANAWNGVNFSGYNLQNVCSSLSVVEEEENTTKNQISIYPNPTNGIVNISSLNETINQVNVYDITGRLLKSQNLNTENEIISIQELPSAMYLIKVKTAKGTKTVKIVKQ